MRLKRFWTAAGKWSDWYKTAIPRAEDAYTEHLRIEGKK
jgi:hypothetical protein